jgi:DNA-binding beta-propeller fold protein YncE
MRTLICVLRRIAEVIIVVTLMITVCYGQEILDQVNNPDWTGGATNFVPVNQVSQTFVPSLPYLRVVEVALMTGNPGQGDDQVTLKILGFGNQELTSITANIPEGFDGFWRFNLPGEGISVTPGEPITILLQDTGKVTFWWKYNTGNPYLAGQAYVYGSPFNNFDFFFKTYGSQSFSPGTIQLPQTGQTKCYDSAGIQLPSCAGTGQDGEIQAGVTWPNPRFVITYCNASAPCAGQSSDCDADPSTDVVTDKLTGLMWARNGNLTNGTTAWNQAIDFANASTLCGYTNWGIPNINELESLVNADESYTTIWLNSNGFTNVQSDLYWSSTTFASYTSYAWIVSMWNGYGVYYNKDNGSYYVWPVRSGQVGRSFGNSEIWKTGQTTSYRTGDDGDLERGIAWPAQRFNDNGNGVVTDNLTSLVWLKNTNCINTNYPSFDNDEFYGDGSVTWQHALDFVKDINNRTYPNCGAGYTDWRLPNGIELRSLIDYSRDNVSLPASYPFTNLQSRSYWSSTTLAYRTDGAWIVSMWNGYVAFNDKDYYDDYDYYVWPVRSGQVGGSFDYYCDGDSDGYISSTVSDTCTGSGCVPVGCQITPGDDCNDNDKLVNTGAAELCDGIDNNCNGQIDDGVYNVDTIDLDSGKTFGGGGTTDLAIDSMRNIVWISHDDASNGLRKIDVAATVTGIPVGPLSARTLYTGIVLDGIGNWIYVYNDITGELIPVDGADNSIYPAISVGSVSWRPAVNKLTGRMYLPMGSDQKVKVVDIINPASPTVIAEIPVGKEPQGIAVIEADNWIYSANNDGTVSAINGADYSKVTTIPVANDDGDNIVINQVTKKAYVSYDGGPFGVSVIDVDPASPDFNKVINIELTSPPEELAVNETTNRIYVNIDDGSTGIGIINGSTDKLEQVISVPGSQALHFAVDEVLGRIYVSDYENNAVHVIDGNPLSPTFNKKLETISVGRFPWAIGVNKNTHKVYVANYGSNTISVLTPVNIYYRDADGDGYGNPNLQIQACSQSAGYVANNTDCNDSNEFVNPGTAEVCKDGKDNDCDGQTDDKDPDCAVCDNATPINFAAYFPLGLQTSWIYKNVADSSDTYTETVFECSTFAGNPACKIGTDSNNYGIGYNDGSSINIYATVENGDVNDFPDVTIGDVTDGQFLNAFEQTNFIMIREWDKLDPALKSIYGTDPSLNQLILWVTYDSNYPSNSQNSIVGSNLCASLPDYAVTHLEWYQKGVGKIADLDIDANSGDIGTLYELTDYAISYYCDRDLDGYISSTVTDTCTGSGCVPQVCRIKAGNDCNDKNADINPSAAETCDSVDNDCDGSVDEDLIRQTTCGVGACAGNTGAETCSAGKWINNSCDPWAGAAVEICGNGTDNDCNGIADIAENDCINVPTLPGPGDIVTPIDPTTGTTPVVITFDNVTDGGTTSVTTSDTGQALPDGYKLGEPPVYYEITTTALYTGQIQVCINYSGVFFDNESAIKLLHYESGVWSDVTLSLDMVNDIICGNVSSLSPFVIVEPSCTDADKDGYFVQGGCGTQVDCNDSNAAITPGAAEICGDGIDNDCDGKADLLDLDCAQPKLAVTKSGNGGGTVTGTGINCGADCYETYAKATTVTLTATADKNSIFVQWTGACSGANSKCTVTVDSAKNVTAEFKPKSYDLKVTLAGNGAGKVSSDRVGIECGNGSKLCSTKYEYNIQVVLTAAPLPDDKHSAFEKWTGDCNSCKNSLTCSVTVSKAMNCTVNFKAFELKTAPGVCTGKITGDLSGIECAGDCSEKYAPGQVVTLSYTKDELHSLFKEWRGCDKGTDLKNPDSCKVTMKAVANVSAVCTAYDLKVSKTGVGAGGGIVRSEPSGIDCGQDCTEKYAPGHEVTLTAFDTMYGKFNGWTIECKEGKNPKTSVCTVNMDKAKTVTASFAAVEYKVKVTGSGKVTSNISGIDCGKDCSEKYAPGQVVVLTAVSLPDAMHSKFVKWKGVCGEGVDWTGSTCTVTPSDAKGAKNSIEAEFVSVELKVKVTGSGKVTSNISGIDCGKDCTEKYALDRQVTLTAQADTGYEFIGWSGNVCAGNNPLTLPMTGAKSVTAQFIKKDSSGKLSYKGLVCQAAIDSGEKANKILTGSLTKSNSKNILSAPLSGLTGASTSKGAYVMSGALAKTASALSVMSSGAVKASETFSDWVYGDCGGYAEITITASSSGSFSGSIIFDDYCDMDVTINGMVKFSGSVNINKMMIQNIKFQFDNVSGTLAGESIIMTGSFSINPASVPASAVFDLVISEQSTQKVYRLENIKFTMTQGDSFVEVTISGKYFDPDYGYSQISTLKPLRYDIYGGDFWPYDGILVSDGSNKTKAKLTAISSYQYKIEADTNGDGIYEYNSGNMYWPNF